MAGLRIYINNTLKGRPDMAAHRLVSNLANMAQQTASGLAVNFVKKSIYKLILPGAIQQLDFDGMLAVTDYVSGMPVFSPYDCSNPLMPVRNALVFETNDKSVKIYIYDVKIDVTFENTIVRTPVTKRRGTIKEYISAKDYTFSLTGSLISNSQYMFPIAELQEVIKLFKTEENFSVYNVFMNQFEVTKVVLEGATIPQSSANYVNTIPFSLRLLSDEDYQLTIENEK